MSRTGVQTSRNNDGHTLTLRAARARRGSAWSACIVAVGASVLTMSGCAGSRATGPYAPIGADARDTAKASRLNAEAAELLNQATGTSDSAAMRKAEALLREALAADLYYGPAHNNLGVIFLGRDELYEAAAEFEWARKLMPGHPDPRVNLAFTLESAGRVDDAIATYRTALEVLPDDIASMQGLARLQIRSGRRDDRTPRLLSEIAMRGESKAWREWAQGVSAPRRSANEP
ncbi:MAG: tetratricopeptide repeat protein [Phycisphaerae bacterium]|jgi:Tfp pilus assembly protein PilF